MYIIQRIRSGRGCITCNLYLFLINYYLNYKLSKNMISLISSLRSTQLSHLLYVFFMFTLHWLIYFYPIQSNILILLFSAYSICFCGFGELTYNVYQLSPAFHSILHNCILWSIMFYPTEQTNIWVGQGFTFRFFDSIILNIL